MFIGGLPLLIIVLLIFAAATRRAAPSPFRLAQRVTPGEALCGKCGYAVQPGTTANVVRCPECGQLYAEAGLVTPALAARFGRSLWDVIIQYTLFALLFSLIVGVPAAILAAQYAEDRGARDPRLWAAAAGLPITVLFFAIAAWASVVYARRLKKLTGESNPRLPRSIRR